MEELKNINEYYRTGQVHKPCRYPGSSIVGDFNGSIVILFCYGCGTLFHFVPACPNAKQATIAWFQQKEQQADKRKKREKAKKLIAQFKFKPGGGNKNARLGKPPFPKKRGHRNNGSK